MIFKLLLILVGFGLVIMLIILLVNLVEVFAVLVYIFLL